MRATNLLLAALAAIPVPASGQPVDAASITDFRSIELRGGGMVTVRRGPMRRVTVREGNAESRLIRAEGERLIIDECRRPCPRGHRIEVDITTPEVAGLVVTDGGVIRVQDGFPPQAAIAASVSSGGMIDLRSLAAARVTASVREGGRILARPGREMDASVSNGGNVTYWGEARVRSTVRNGGVVEQGAAADQHRLLARLDPPLLPPPALPALPPPSRPRKH